MLDAGVGGVLSSRLRWESVWWLCRGECHRTGSAPGAILNLMVSIHQLPSATGGLRPLGERKPTDQGLGIIGLGRHGLVEAPQPARNR